MDRALLAFVGVEPAERDPRMVVDCDEERLLSGSLAVDRGVRGDPVARPVEGGDLLDVDVEQVAGIREASAAGSGVSKWEPQSNHAHETENLRRFDQS